MKRLLIGLAILSVFAIIAYAQPCPECRGEMPGGFDFGMGFGGPPLEFGMRFHNPHWGEVDEVESIRGRVANIERGPRGGMRLMIESDSRLSPVLVGPERASDKIQKNARVEITGKRISRGGKSVLMAQKIAVEEKTGMVALEPQRDHKREHIRFKSMHKKHAY